MLVGTPHPVKLSVLVALGRTLWIRRVLVRSEEGQLQRRPRGRRFHLPRLYASAPRIDTRRNDMVLLGTASGAIMPDDMGSFRVDVEIENPSLVRTLRHRFFRRMIRRVPYAQTPKPGELGAPLRL